MPRISELGATSIVAGQYQFWNTSYQDHGNAGSTETIDFTVARVHRIVLDSTTCTLTFSGWPASGRYGELLLIVVHDNTSNSRSIIYPAGAKYPNATPPFMPTTTANARSKLMISSFDGMTTYDVDLIGNDYG